MIYSILIFKKQIIVALMADRNFKSKLYHKLYNIHGNIQNKKKLFNKIIM